MRKRGRRIAGRFCGAALLLAALTLARPNEGFAKAQGEEKGKKSDFAQEVDYAVYFICSGSPERPVLNPQRGSAAEGTCLEVTFPEQIVGADGYLWVSEEKSPQRFELYQYGGHKYYISYRREKKAERPDAGDSEAEKKLEQWKETSWKADCAVTGQDPQSGRDPYLVVENDRQNHTRIRNLISMIEDSEWHYFYLIGRNFAPQTGVMGLYPEFLYSSVDEEKFTVGEDSYRVLRVGVKRRVNPERCEHEWEQTAGVLNSCLVQGNETWTCRKCGGEETVFLPAAGHLDEDGDGRCDRCFGPVSEQEAEPFWWRKGDVQMRRIRDRVYRFRCVDEDYSDGLNGRRMAALFLCDSVIRSDVDSDQSARRVFRFGAGNNYKTSEIRGWLKENCKDDGFQMEPVSIGISAAYTGSTKQGEREQFDGSRLTRHDIGFQLIQDPLFCLSLEEAIKYREELWRFGVSGGGSLEPETQVSPYSQGYYLRTPFYETDENGVFRYGTDVYVVDLVNGSIHTAAADSETYGLRPAFALPQEAREGLKRPENDGQQMIQGGEK